MQKSMQTGCNAGWMRFGSNSKNVEMWECGNVKMHQLSHLCEVQIAERQQWSPKRNQTIPSAIRHKSGFGNVKMPELSHLCVGSDSRKATMIA